MIIKRNKKITLYHVTRVENVPSIKREGLLTKYFNNRRPEHRLLGIKDTGLIYFNLDPNKLTKKEWNVKKALVVVEIPIDVYEKMDRLEGDPMWWRLKDDPNWQETLFEVFKKIRPDVFGKITIEEFMKKCTPLEWCSPENAVCLKEDVSPEYIKKVIYQ